MDSRLDDATCWTLIREAASGQELAREEFARRYLPVVRAFLSARDGGFLAPGEVEDAVQEVFFECLKERGLIERARPGAGHGFRAFLSAACRNVARRVESRRARRRERPAPTSLGDDGAPLDEETMGRAFDRAWAQGLLREAAERQATKARSKGPEAVRRVELLRLRFQEDMPVRDIARSWELSADYLHHEYAQARKEYEGALREVIAFHNPGQPNAIARELGELLALFGD